MNPEPYHFLFRHDGEPLVEELIEIRDVIDSLPATKETFRPLAYLDRETVWHFQNTAYLRYFVGTWRLPHWFAGGGGGLKQRFINPNASGVGQYSLTGVECACGNVITDIARNCSIEEYHAGGCTPEDREALRNRVKDKQLHRILAGAHLNQEMSVIAPSIGVSLDRVSLLVKDVGWDWNHLRSIGRHRMAVTIDRFKDEGYTHSEIAQAFGRSKSFVRDYSTRRVFNRQQVQATA